MGDEIQSQSQSLLNNKSKLYARSKSHAFDELRVFRRWLKWMCVDQSDATSTILSWFVFIMFAIVVPCLSHFLLACADCDARHDRPYDSVVQFSLSAVAALSFICLSGFVKKFGLRRFLFLDKLCDESETVRKGYMAQLNRSVKILFIFVMPCFAAESIYKIWWYSSGGTQIPFLGNVIVSDTVACILELSSWLYRTMVFFLVCVLFRLICYLQILRLQDFAQIFHVDSDVETVLREHLRIRRHLRIISHRYRRFILLALVLVTASQLASLLMTTRSTADLHIYKSGELALCSVSLLAGLLILLRSAVRITHKAQSVTCLAAKWHVCATIDSFESAEGETPPISEITSNQVFPVSSEEGSSEDVGDEEDELDNTKFVHSYAYSTLSFQKRQALGMLVLLAFLSPVFNLCCLGSSKMPTGVCRILQNLCILEDPTRVRQPFWSSNKQLFSIFIQLLKCENQTSNRFLLESLCTALLEAHTSLNSKLSTFTHKAITSCFASRHALRDEEIAFSNTSCPFL